MPNATATKERPILFSAPMVKALLDGRKTQTRRTNKCFEFKHEPGGPRHAKFYMRRADMCWNSFETMAELVAKHCPHGKPGDHLWVKEPWQYYDWTEDGYPWIRYRAGGADKFCENIPDDWEDRVQNIFAELSDPTNYDIDKRASDKRWRSARFMPRWASRLTLEITDVRVQRVQEISEEDAKAEGIGRHLLDGGRGPAFGLSSNDEYPTAREAFLSLFYDINKRAKRGDNPWVWALTFKVVAHA